MLQFTIHLSEDDFQNLSRQRCVHFHNWLHLKWQINLWQVNLKRESNLIIISVAVICLREEIIFLCCRTFPSLKRLDMNWALNENLDHPSIMGDKFRESGQKKVAHVRAGVAYFRLSGFGEQSGWATKTKSLHVVPSHSLALGKKGATALDRGWGGK